MVAGFVKKKTQRSSLSQKYLSSSPFHHLAGLLSELQYIINYWLTFTTAGKGNFFESTDGTYETLAIHLPSALMEKNCDDDGEDCGTYGI